VFENGMLRSILGLLRKKRAGVAKNGIKGRFLIWYTSPLPIKVKKLSKMSGLDM
jgi:hypothetical protein